MKTIYTKSNEPITAKIFDYDRFFTNFEYHYKDAEGKYIHLNEKDTLIVEKTGQAMFVGNFKNMPYFERKSLVPNGFFTTSYVYKAVCDGEECWFKLEQRQHQKLQEGFKGYDGHLKFTKLKDGKYVIHLIEKLPINPQQGFTETGISAQVPLQETPVVDSTSGDFIDELAKKYVMTTQEKNLVRELIKFNVHMDKDEFYKHLNDSEITLDLKRANELWEAFKQW